MEARTFFLIVGIDIASVFALAACSHTVRTAASKTGSANFKVFIPQGARKFDLPRNQKIVLGSAIAQANPVYPPQLIARNIPDQSVCLAVAVNESGTVYMERPLFGLQGCPIDVHAVEPAFVEAAVDAAKGWQFVPALLCTFKEGVNAQTRTCPSSDAQARPIAISLAFVFTFTQSYGRPSVHTGWWGTSP